MPKHRRPSRSARRLSVSLVALALSTCTLLVASSPATAARNGARASSLELVVLGSADLASTTDTDQVANHGDMVTFALQTTADRPFVGLRCYQGEAFVYDAYVGYFADYYSDKTWFTLDSTYWAEGVEADCTARLLQWDRHGREDVLATTFFSVAP
jgi:hypothetical protein